MTEPVMEQTTTRPLPEILLIFLLVLVGTNALFVGIGFMLIRDGSAVGLTPTWLEGSPFTNYFGPGLLLFLFLGVVPLLASIGLLFKPAWKWPQRLNVFQFQYWGLTFATYSGIIFCSWIVVQQLVTRYFVLQPIVSGAGVVVIVLSLLPRVTRRYHQKTTAA